MSEILLEKHFPDLVTPEPEPETGAYAAFEAKNRVRYLRIALAQGITRAPAYLYLLDVISDGPRGTEICLVFSFLLVKLRGQHLQEVADALSLRQCTVIREFSPDLYPPPESGKPLIESIEIVVKEE